MGLNSKSHDSTLLEEEENQEIQDKRFKDHMFKIINAHLSLNEDASPYIYYLINVVETVAFMCFILHSGLSIYDSVVILVPQLQTIAKYINFFQFVLENPSYKFFIALVVTFILLVQVIISAVSSWGVMFSKQGQNYVYLKKITNWLLLFVGKAFSGPLFAFALALIYCNPNWANANNVVCYDSLGIIGLFMGVFILVCVLCQVIILSTVYYIKNPLSKSFLGQSNRIHYLVKSLIKIVIPLYFLIDYQIQFLFVIMFGLVILFGGYIFLFRMMSDHTYFDTHFYAEYHMQSFLLFLSITNLTNYYIQGAKNNSRLSLCFAFISSVLFSMVMVGLQKYLEKMAFQESLEKGCKKNYIQKFIFIMLNGIFNQNQKKAKLNYRIYRAILSRQIPALQLEQAKPQNYQQQVLLFFLHYINHALVQIPSNNIVKLLRCYILKNLGQQSYGFHQCQQIKQKDPGFIDSFMLYRYQMSNQAFTTQALDKNSRDFINFAKFQEQLSILQKLTDRIALNNLQYWQQLGQTDPSLAKLRNLASFYKKNSCKISQQYKKVYNLFPQSLYSSALYFFYLLNVAIQLKQAIQVRDIVETLIQNRGKGMPKNGDNQVIDDDNVTVMSLSSFGSNMGTVINCNNHIFNLVGYEKKAMIKKNISKIMPKVYSEQHNNFIINFIKREDSHKINKQKIVNALNSNSYLVQIKLTVRIMLNAENQLVIMGILKKLPQTLGKAKMLFSFQNGQLLAVSQGFQQLTNNKITGQYVLANQDKLNTYFPQFRLDQIEQKTIQKSQMEIASVEEQSSLKKHIEIQFIQAKQYTYNKIGFIQVTQDITFRPQSTKVVYIDETLSNKLNFQAKTTINNNNQGSKKYNSADIVNFIHFNSKMIKEDGIQHQSSFYQTFSQQKIDQSRNITDNDLSKQLVTHRKIQDFVKKYEGLSVQQTLKISYLIIWLGITIFLVSILINHQNYLNKAGQVYTNLNSSTTLSYLYASTNYLVNQLWSIPNSSALPNISLTNSLKNTIAVFSSTYYDLLTNTTLYPASLTYNQQITCNTTIYRLLSANIVANSISLPLSTAINNYIATANTFIQPKINTKQYKQMQAMYLNTNGDKLLPDFGVTSMNQHLDYFKNITQNQITTLIYLKISSLFLAMLMIVVSYFLGNLIKKRIQLLVSVYNNLHIWNISQMALKCHKYLYQRGVKPQFIRRSTSLLRIFPNNKLVSIIDKNNKAQIKQKGSQLQMAEMTQKSFAQLNKTDANKPDTPQNQPEKQKLKQQNQQIVNIVIRESSIKAILTLSFLVVVMGAILASSLFLISQDLDSLKYSARLLYNFGQVRKNCHFLNYYSYRLINSPDSATVSLAKRQIDLFYNYSTQIYKQMQDQVLKNVYYSVQLIQNHYVESPPTKLAIYYSNISQSLLNATKIISPLGDSVYKTKFDDSRSASGTRQIIIMVILTLLICLIVVFLHYIYVTPIKHRLKQSLQMVSMLPPWILQRTGPSLQIIQK